MVVEKLVVELSGNVAALRKALAQGNVALAQTELAAGKAQFKVSGIAKASKDAAPSINAFRGSLTSLVASTLKLPGPLANVTGLLGMMAFGTATTVGILAGLAAIAGAYKLIGKEASEADKLIEGARESLLKAANIRALGGAAGVDAAAAREAQANIARLGRARTLAVGLEREDPSAAGAVARIDKQILENAKVVSEAGQQAAEALKKQADAVKETGTAAAGAKAPVDALADALAAVNARLRDIWYARSVDVDRGFRDRRQMARASAPPGMGSPNLLPFGPTLTAQAPQGGGGGALGGGRVGEALAGLADGARYARDVLKNGFAPGALAVAAIFEVFKGIMEPLQPILDVVSGLLRSVGSVLGSIFAPILKVVATAFSYVIQAIGWFVEGIGKFIDAIVPDWISKVGKGLAEQGQALQENARASRKAMEQTTALGEAVEKVTGGISGLPAWFRVEAFRYNAAGGGTMPGGPGGPGVQPGNNGVTITGPVTVQVTPAAGESGEAVLQRVEVALRQRAASGRVGALDVAIAGGRV